MIVVSFADNIMVGRYTTEALAAASFVNNVFNVAILACLGFTYGLTPLAGTLFGRCDHRNIGATVRTALRINIIFTILVMAVMTVLYFNVDNLGQPTELLPLIKPYYLIMLAGMLPITIFNLFAQWSYATGDSRTPMWIILGANLLNIFGNYLLIYGSFGAPEMGLTGAGLATFASRIMCMIKAIYIWCHTKRCADYRQGFRDKTLRPYTNKKIWLTSLPIAGQMSFETGAFSISAIMAGWLGKIDLAAYQIIVIIGTLGFCVYYSIGAAISVKIANAAGGKGDVNIEMRRVAKAGYMVMLFFMLLATIIFITIGTDLMHAFTDDKLVLASASALIFPLVLYQLGDATQVTFANALRGTSHVLPMLWIAFISYIVVGLPSTYVFAFTFGMGLWGIVLSFSVSLFLAGALFLYFFLRATRNRT